MTGTIVNVLAITAGSFLGIILKKGFSEKMKSTIMQAIGLAVVIIGISGVIKGMLYITNSGELDTRYTLIMIFSLVLGGIIGESIDIEAKLDAIGNWFQSKLVKGESKFAEGFVTSTLIYCVGAMAIVGSFEDGLLGNPNTLFAKSVLDGVMSIILAASLGIGVLFSFVPVLLYQGTLTLLAGTLQPILTDVVITQMSVVGSILIMSIGINILGIKKIKVGNLLPAIFLPAIYYIFELLFGLFVK